MSTNENTRYNILVSGDSISRGVIYDESRNKYTLLKENYVNLLQKKLKGIVYNTSRFGSTIVNGVEKLKKQITKEKPDIVLLEYGGNDCDFNWDEIAADPDSNHEPKTDFDIFDKYLNETIEFLKKNGIIPVLVTLPPLNADKYFSWVSKNNPIAKDNILRWLGSVTKIYWWQERYNSVIMKIANETSTRLIDIRGAFLQYPDFTKLLCIDGIHPNRDGHMIISEKILDYIKSGYNYLLST